MNAPDTQTPADQLEGTNVPEFQAAVRRAVNALETLGGTVTIWRDKHNRRDFYITGEPLGLPERLREKICTIKTGAAWSACSSKLTGALSAAAQALGYHWKAVGYYASPAEGLGLAVKGKAPKGSRLIVLVTPHPAGFSR